MEDTSDSAGKSRRRSRSSLVERAAKKMATVRGTIASAAPEATSDAGASPTAPPAHPEPVGEVLVKEKQRAAPGNAPMPEDSLHMATLAAAPAAAIDSAETAPRQRQRKSPLVKIDTAGLTSRGLLTPDSKRNRTVEEFRLIKRLVLSRRWEVQEAPGNTIVVTSALPSEGKTTTAINLAMSIAAEKDLRVLLIDADFVKPRALQQLGVSATRGLIDVLEDPQLEISDVILKTDIEKLSLIPSGQPHARCTELLASTRMDDLIQELANRYEDRILIFDSPPVLATSESVVLASHMGQVVFVVQAGRTKRESVDSALELLGDRPNLGLLLNRTSGGFGKTEFGAYYGSYYYGYGEEKK